MVNKKKMAFIALILGLFLLMPTTQAKEQNQTSQVSAYYYYNNNPIYSVQIQATNYDKAFKKLKNGKFEEEDFQHFSLDDVKKQYQVEGTTVQLTEQLTFGKGIKLSSNQANTALELLYRDAQGYLNFINEFEKATILHNPESTRYRFSNEEGLSIGKIPYGKTIFGNSADKTFKLVTIDDNTETIYLGNTILEKERIFVDAPRVSGDYTADIGETITYRIRLDESKKIELELSPHFVVDSINASYQERNRFLREKVGVAGGVSFMGELPEDVTLTQSGIEISALYTEEKENDLKKTIANLQSTRVLEIALDTVTGDYLDVTGHIASSSIYQVETMTGNYEGVQSTIEVENQNIRQGIYVIADGKYLLTPQIYSNNVNFVMTDGNSHELLTGVEYILGRFDKSGQVSILNYNSEKELSWEKSELEKGRLIEAESNFTISGNQIIYLDGYKSALPFNEKIWAYDESNQTKSNEALFKLRGLSGEYTYFLKQVNVPEGYAEATDVQIFKATKDSESKAQFGDYQVNGFILDLDYGKTEYNALQILKEGQNATLLPNPYWMALIFIVVTIFVVSGFAYLVIRKG
ncbi:TPA: hypothetical protein TY768_000607 [Streptococcus suis]|nr:hypothetical protein [Streptococcus suis]